MRWLGHQCLIDNRWEVHSRRHRKAPCGSLGRVGRKGQLLYDRQARLQNFSCENCRFFERIEDGEVIRVYEPNGESQYLECTRSEV